MKTAVWINTNSGLYQVSSSHSSAAGEVLKVPTERRILRLAEINREMRALHGEPEVKIINKDERFICGIRILHCIDIKKIN